MYILIMDVSDTLGGKNVENELLFSRYLNMLF